MVFEECKQRIISINTPMDSDEMVLFVVQIDGKDFYYGKDYKNRALFCMQSSTPQMPPIIQQTDQLSLRFNCKCTYCVDGIKNSTTMHVLACSTDNLSEIEAFIRLTQAFCHELDDDPKKIYNLFTALSNLFHISDNNPIETQGLFAELYTMKYFDDHGVAISNYWQNEAKLKFDFSISAMKKIEIKSTTKEERVHHFRHEQLMSDIYDIYVVSLLMRSDPRGLSLLDLIFQIQKNNMNNYKLLLFLEKIRRTNGEEDLLVVRYDETYIKNNIRVYRAADIPKFQEGQPRGVTHTEYNSDLSNVTPTNFIDVFNWIKEV